MIPVFVASSDRFSEVEWMTKFSVYKNTRSHAIVHVIRPQWFGMEESGCTGFTNVRYAIPQLCRELGYEFGVYLDVDMLVTGDIADLWQYRRANQWVCLSDGCDEVSVIAASLEFPDKSTLHTYAKGSLTCDREPLIPLTWNSEDCICPGMNLLHFTALPLQPWFYEHPDREAVALYEEYRERRHSRDGAKFNA